MPPPGCEPDPRRDAPSLKTLNPAIDHRPPPSLLLFSPGLSPFAISLFSSPSRSFRIVHSFRSGPRHTLSGATTTSSTDDTQRLLQHNLRF